MGWDEYVDEGRGGLLMAYTGTNRDAYYLEGQYGGQLYIEQRLDNPEDYPHIPDGVIKHWFGLPNGWRIIKNGAEIEAVGWTAKKGTAQDPPTKIRNDSPMGQLITQMQTVDPDGKTLTNGYTPLQAAYWKAALSHSRWDAVAADVRKETTPGNWETVKGGKQVSMPVELLDIAGTAAAEFDIATLNLAPEVLTALTDAAHASTSYQAFVGACINGGPALMVHAGDSKVGPQIYEALRLL